MRLKLFELGVVIVCISLLVATIVVAWAIEVYAGTAAQYAVYLTVVAVGLIGFFGRFIVRHMQSRRK